MPVILELEDHDAIYETVKDRVIMINDLANTTEEDKERIKALTITQLNSDTISTIPRCRCEATKGKYAIGKTCPVCKEVVQSTIDESVRSMLWFRRPGPVKKLINPVVFAMLSNYFTKNSYNAIQYLTDSSYSPTTREPKEIDKLSRFGFERDLNYFTENFDEIFLALMDVFSPKASKPYGPLIDFISKYRRIIFSNFQPILNKSLFVADKTNLGIYMEDSIKDALDAIYHVVSIDKDFYERNPKVIVNRTARMQARQAAFYYDYIGTNFQPKPGHFRRHVVGSRLNFCGRGVITSETGNHRHDEIGIPWRIAVPIFQHHLAGKLMRHGYDHNKALSMIYKHVCVYNPLIHKFLDEIFKEFPGGRGPAFILHRNPTLGSGSMQRVFGRLKTDVRDSTISMSILIVVAPNA